MEVVKLTKMDLDEIMQFERETWPEGTQASKEAILSRLKTFQEGIIGIKEEGKVIAVSSSMVLPYKDIKDIPSWTETTSNGMITNHDPEGTILYIVSLGVHPDFQRRGHGRKLIKKQEELAKNKGLKYLALQSRVPRFELYNGKTGKDIQSYLNGSTSDEQINFYQKNGFNVIAIKENGMKDDKESKNYGILMSKPL